MVTNNEMLEVELKKTRYSNVWICNDQQMRLAAIRHFAKANGLTVRTESEGHGFKFMDGTWSRQHIGRVFLVYPNKQKAMLCKLGMVVEPEDKPVRMCNEFQYIADGVEKWVPANWHKRLQGGGRGRYCSTSGVKYRDGTVINTEHFTGVTRKVAKEAA